MFKNVEHLVFRIPLSTSSVSHLVILLSNWSKISTLIFVGHLTSDEQVTIAECINNLEQLTRLDLRLEFNFDLLRPNLRRVHHLSVGFKLSHDALRDVFPHIGPHCNRLWIKQPRFPNSSLNILLSWVKSNVSLFNRLTHFGCSSNIDEDALQFIDSRFTSLRVWYIAGETTG